MTTGPQAGFEHDYHRNSAWQAPGSGLDNVLSPSLDFGTPDISDMTRMMTLLLLSVAGPGRANSGERSRGAVMVVLARGAGGPSRHEPAQSQGFRIPADNFPNELARVFDYVGKSPA